MVDYTNTSLHFKLGKEIGGEGKNSKVYLAHDFQLDADIVVKQIKKAEFKDANNFFDEAKILHSTSHANIAPIHYSTQDDEHIYISMPLFKKGSLNTIIDSRFLSLTEILKYSIDFLSGLHHIHTLRLLHCDIKPTNILLSDTNDAVLTDFGLSKYLNDDGLTQVDKLYHIHRAPETLISNTINHQSDIYQAGLTVYRLCNGNPFYKNQMIKYQKDGKINMDKLNEGIFKGNFPDRSLYLHYIPQSIKSAIRKALQPNPADRYNSVLDFLNDLAKIEINYDWCFYPEDSASYWRCESDNKAYEVLITSADEKHLSVKTTKKVAGAAREQQILAYCNKKIANEDGYKLIKAILHNKSL
jgi:eukaryotic-like serine/threonine-protein kinase